jgi:carbon storage regulator
MQVKKWKVGDAMRVGPDIWIKVVEVRGKQVRLGIVAPRETAIFRDELVEVEKTRVDGKTGSGPSGL